ncbi:MAG: KAP family NTPase, partial [Burkholderiaceae bacterium]|nr:KAP family NTPase [Burkholderiaceae bacterium]
MKKRLQELAERKESIEQLKKLLRGAVPQNGKIVVFVDELDRCSPAYAIRFLERIKHLFEIRGVVFVLLWNRTQIHQAVKTFYGQGTDGQMYLDRFVDYPIRLPNHHANRRNAGLGLVVEAEIQKLQGNEQVLLHEVATLLGSFGDVLRLTAREIKHVCAWWVMTNGRLDEIFEAWLLCVKVKRPDIYESLAIESPEAH